MANEIEIVVKSTNKASAGFKAAKDDAKSLEKSMKGIGEATEDAEKKVSGLGSKLSTAGKAAGVASGVAIGGALASGFASSLQFDSANAKLRAQLGGSAEYSKEMGGLAGDLYAGAYGDSMGEVTDALAAVVQSGALMENATNDQIKSITGQAMSMAKAFGVDVPKAMQAVSRMVKTGMVPDAQAGLDLIARAFQQLGPNAEDVLDTFQEYSSQFQKIGLDGPEALGMINQMMQAGARNTDVAADALKEFSIRAVDGSKTTAEGMKAIGLNADEMSKKFAAGGQTANDAFQLVIDKLKAVPDPVMQSQAAVALFGTKAEDLGAALFAIDPSKAVVGLGQLAGAGKEVDKAMGSDAQSKITSMQRHVEEFLASFANAPGILGTAGGAITAFGGQALAMGSQLGMIAIALPDGMKKAAVDTALSFGKMTLSAAGYVAASIAGAAASTAAWIAANIAMIAATGGIILIIGAVIAIVVLLVKHWDWVKEKAGALWEGIRGTWQAIKDFVVGAVTAVIDFVKEHWKLILAIVMGPLGILIGQIITHWDKIKGIFKTGVNAVIDAVKFLAQLPGIVIGFIGRMVSGAISKAGELIGWFKGLGGRLIGAIGNIAGMLADVGWNIIQGIGRGIERGWNWLVDKVKNLAKSLLDAALHAIHVRSPSKDFEEKFGAMIPAGAALGVTRNAPIAYQATRDMALGMLREAGHYRTATPATSQIMAAVSREVAPVLLKIQTSGTPVEEFIAELIRRYVRIQGGDVQQVFGR